MTSSLIQQTFEQGQGILRLIPAFVPRRFSQPGWRLRLHPDDYFALGTARGRDQRALVLLGHRRHERPAGARR